jgi:hypothetical protein
VEKEIWRENKENNEQELKKKICGVRGTEYGGK